MNRECRAPHIDTYKNVTCLLSTLRAVTRFRRMIQGAFNLEANGTAAVKLAPALVSPLSLRHHPLTDVVGYIPLARELPTYPRKEIFPSSDWRIFGRISRTTTGF